MKVSFLAEGGSGLGFGHVMRCIALSDAFREYGIASSLFINGDRAVKSILGKTRYRLLNWLEQENQAFDLLRGSDVIILDSYLAKSSFYKRIAELTPMPVYFDDNKRIACPPGVVINGAVFAGKIGYPKSKGIKYLLGLPYVPLRREFWDSAAKKTRKDIRTVLITFGAGDIRGLTPEVLTALCREYPQLHKKVIIGKGFKKLNVGRIKSVRDARVELISAPPPVRIKRIMQEADVAVSAAGQTLYELIRLGVPAIAVTVAENQLKHSQGLKMAGLLPCVISYTDRKFIEEICRCLSALNYARRKRISCLGMKMIDGQGARRAVEEIINYKK